MTDERESIMPQIITLEMKAAELAGCTGDNWQAEWNKISDKAMAYWRGQAQMGMALAAMFGEPV